MSSYTVQPGDTLFAIARRAGTTLELLLSANPSVTDPNRIEVGQTLLIPDGQSGTSGGATLDATAARARVLAEAELRRGVPYRMSPPPDGVNNLDCSLFVLTAFSASGAPFPSTVRTAEQIRQASIRIDDWATVRPGDLLFFENTYDAGPPASDGHIASHVGISEGAGTQRMWDCHSSDDSGRPGVTETNIRSDYWQGHIFEARRPPMLREETGSTSVPEVFRVTDPGVRLREKPGTSQTVIVMDVGLNTLVTALSTESVQADGHTWKNVRLADGRTGWVAAEFLTTGAEGHSEPPAPTRFSLIDAGVRLRQGPGINETVVVADLGRGTEVTAVSADVREGDGHQWLQVKTAGGQSGWVAREFLRPADGNDFGLAQDGDHHFTFQNLWPCIQTSAMTYGADPQVVAAILCQESGFTNYLVHQDGTGHGLIGLDDNGLLPDFEHWSGLSCGRGRTASPIPPAPQIQYCARSIADLTGRFGSAINAARVWHRGPGLWQDSFGDRYEQLIRQHIRDLFD